MSDRSLLLFHGLTTCDACRKARRWLDAQGVEYRVHDVRDDGLDARTLERWASRCDWRELLNTRSLTWRKLPERDRDNVTRDRALRLMQDNPTLVKRPVLEHRDFVAVGFTPEKYENLFA